MTTHKPRQQRTDRSIELFRSLEGGDLLDEPVRHAQDHHDLGLLLDHCLRRDLGQILSGLFDRPIPIIREFGRNPATLDLCHFDVLGLVIV